MRRCGRSAGRDIREFRKGRLRPLYRRARAARKSGLSRGPRLSLGEQSGRGKAAKFRAPQARLLLLRPAPGTRRGAAPKAGVPNAQRCALGWAAALGPAPCNGSLSAGAYGRVNSAARFGGAGREMARLRVIRPDASGTARRRTGLFLGHGVEGADEADHGLNLIRGQNTVPGRHRWIAALDDRDQLRIGLALDIGAAQIGLGP
jgi:hypothetical protein